MASKRSLKDMLAMREADLMSEDPDTPATPISDVPPSPEDQTSDGLCVECGDQPLDLACLNCDESFCQVCFEYLHRTGKRKHHETQMRMGNDEPSNSGAISSDSELKQEIEQDFAESEQTDQVYSTDAMEKSPELEIDAQRQKAFALFKENVKFIPMRLTSDERKYFRLLEAALNVSAYTDKVDVLSYTSKVKRIVGQLREMCTVLTGLVVANGLEDGKILMDDKDFSLHAEWFQKVFEIGRRYKIMNPEKMRGTFGKLMYMIMDSRLAQVKESLEFDLYTPILTVHSYLEAHKALEILDDPLILLATKEIIAEGRRRGLIQAEIKQKEQAIERLARKFGGRGAGTEGIRQALYSIGDYHAYLSANRTPVLEMITRLKSSFNQGHADSGYSLGISMGRDGARLSHSHAKQYQYVYQSLTLWSEIMRDMYMLWKLADDDMTSKEMSYRLADTGQGLNRIKPCPKVGRAMHNIIHRAQQSTGSWVGSSVVHLGDHAVPNALFFLDKYLQVPRILNPVNTMLNFLPLLARDPYTSGWVEAQFGSLANLEKQVLVDFFQHAFDGSGGDNFYDAGSCIDGRLTSTWNWTQTISRKPYYKHFLVSGFSGFDGADGF